MTINGIEINETTDIREIVLVFNGLLIQAEGLKEELVTNFNTYQNIDTHGADTLQKFKEVLQSITAIQVKSQNAFEKVAKLDANMIERVSHLQKRIQDENKETYQNIKLLFSQLEPFTQKAINSAVQHVHVDTSNIEASIAKKLEAFDSSDINETIELIDERTQTLQITNDKFHHTSESLQNTHTKLQEHTQALKNTVSNINDSVQSFKGINKSVSTGVKITFLSLGLIAGFGVATFFKIDALSNYYFSAYDKKQQQIEDAQRQLTQKISKLEKLPNFLLQHNIDIRYGIFQDEKESLTSIPFITLNNKQLNEDERYSFSRNEKMYIGFKK